MTEKDNKTESLNQNSQQLVVISETANDIADIADYNSEGSHSVLTIASINQRIIELINTSTEAMEADKGEQALQILEKVERIIEYLNKTGKNSQRQARTVCYYNLACIYQQRWVLEKCGEYLGKALDLMYGFAEEEKSQCIHRANHLVQSSLQYCAIQSQIGEQQLQISRHEKALEIAIKTLPVLKIIFTTAYNHCIQALSLSSSDTSSTIVFGSHVYRNALGFLETLRNTPVFSELNQVSEQLEQTREKIYFWKNNPQNNEKHLRKELKVHAGDEDPTERNLLGVQSSQNWLQTQNIGTIMHMKPLSLQQYTSEDNIIFEISKRKMLQKLMLCSVSYFSIATQLRFIEIEKDKIKKEQQPNFVDKYISTPQSKASQIFHLKSIETICRFVRFNTVYINHLIQSYHKHYKQNLLSIQEQPSVIQYSFINEIKSTRKALEATEQQQMASKKFGYQGFKKRQGKVPYASIKQKLIEVSAVDFLGVDSNVDKNKEVSLPSGDFDESTKPAKSRQMTSNSKKLRNTSSSLKNIKRDRLELLTKQDMAISRNKSKSQNRSRNKSRSKSKKSMKQSMTKAEEPKIEHFNQMTRRNVQFMYKHCRSPENIKISLTKKTFKKGNDKNTQNLQSIEEIQYVRH